MNVRIMYEHEPVTNTTNTVISLNVALSNYERRVVILHLKTHLLTRHEAMGYSGWAFHIGMTMKIGFLENMKKGDDLDTDRNVEQREQ